MTDGMETRKPQMDDVQFIESTLANDFELTGSSLVGNQASHFLSESIQGIQKDGLRIIALVGGPAGGKSTLVGSILEELRAQGLSADSISTDDYGLGTRDWRWEREKDDPLSLKDFALLNAHIKAIEEIDDDSTTVAVPTYDEATGLAIEAGEANFTHKIGRIDVLIVEGDFDAVESPDLSIFIDVPAEARLKARVARDLEKRGEVDAEKVAASFESRHERQFKPHGLPAVKKANLVLKVSPTDNEWRYDIYRKRPSSDINS